MSDESNRDITKEYKLRGGVGRLVEDDGTISRDASLEPPEADRYWEQVIKPRIDAGDHHGIFQYLH